MEIHIKIIGALLLGLTFLHVGFPRYFKWKSEFSGVSLINRQMMYIHTLFIAIVLLLMGLLCLSSATDLTGTVLGRRICLGMAFFWLLRLIVQFFGYSSRLWRGKVFETTIHVVFALMWTYFVIVFGWSAFATES